MAKGFPDGKIVGPLEGKLGTAEGIALGTEGAKLGVADGETELGN